MWQGHDLLKLSWPTSGPGWHVLAFQYPMAIPGLSVASFLRRPSTPAARASTGPGRRPDRRLPRRIPMGEFRKLVREKMALLR